MSRPLNLFWDSCVFIRYLTENPSELVGDIEQYIKDAREKRIKIHFSTIAFTEVRPRYLRPKGFGSAAQFFTELGSAFCPFDPNPNILSLAGLIRDCDPTNPTDPNVGEENKRSIGTPDAIQLATCLYLQDVCWLSDIVFHTFDQGKGKNWEGKCVPLIGFERWFPSSGRTPQIERVCQLSRCMPKHPTPDLVTTIKASVPIVSTERH